MTILKECHQILHVHTVDFVVYLLFSMYVQERCVLFEYRPNSNKVYITVYSI